MKGQKLTGDRNHGSIYMNIFKSVIRTFLTDFLHNYRILSIHIFCTKKVGSDTAFHITILPSVEKLKKTEHKTKWKAKNDAKKWTLNEGKETVVLKQSSISIVSKVP